jgi:hypothetical protein
MEEEEALEFYERITQGTKRFQIISLEHETGSVLNDVKMHPVDKRTLAGVIQQLPDDMFAAVEETSSPEEAEEALEDSGSGLNAVTEGTVDAFEELCQKSLAHPSLTNTQIKHIVSQLNFETLFELGTEIINMSSDRTGDIRGFQKQE